ncbi:hypothetical protein [Hymenobacter daecheongensis]|nr:hypothetical protein [Hymenobacter daecheongensis]
MESANYLGADPTMNSYFRQGHHPGRRPRRLLRLAPQRQQQAQDERR